MGQSKTSTSSTSDSTTQPWSVQQPYLQQAFTGAQTALAQSNDNRTDPTSDYKAPTQFQAQYTPDMMNAFQQELGYGTGNSGIAASSAGAGQQMAGLGAGAAAAGLGGFAGFNPTGGTDYNINAANQYAAGANIPGMVAASMRDANQNYNDITAPAIQRGAAVSGNINSTAPAIQQGIVQRGLAQRAMDTSATLQGNLYQGGLSLAQNQANSDNTARLSALSGLTNGGINSVNSGVSANTGAVGQQAGLFNIANTGAANTLAGNQAPLTNQLQAFNFGQNSPFTSLNNFYNLIGNRSWGGSTTGSTQGTTTSNPSPMSMISGGIGMLGSLF